MLAPPEHFLFPALRLYFHDRCPISHHYQQKNCSPHAIKCSKQEHVVHGVIRDVTDLVRNIRYIARFGIAVNVIERVAINVRCRRLGSKSEKSRVERQLEASREINP